MRLAATPLSVLIFYAGSAAQTPPASKGSLDTAQSQSDKFPAEWFTDAAQDPYHPLPPFSPANTNAPSSITPFSAVIVITSETLVAGRIQTVYGGRERTMRDSAWRLRTDEEIQVGELGENGAAPSVRLVNQIEVHDPVAHCSFRWVEPARKESEKIARIQCQPRSAAVQPAPQQAVPTDGMEAKMTRQLLETLHESPDQTLQIVPLGQKVVAGLNAFGIRQTLIDPNRYAGAPQVTEIWWSPEIKEILLAKPIGEPAGRLGIEMTDIKLQEPDSALFYPPAGYKIVPESQMPH